MFMRMVYDEKLAQAAYVIGCERSREAIVFDPERDVDRYVDLARAHGLRIVAAAETHIHADFLSGARELAEREGARVYLSGEGGEEWSYRWGGDDETHPLRDGDRFEIGGIEFRAIHTPGHTPEHLVYMVTDRAAGADSPIGMIAGDFLFVGDLGRPDLLETAAGRVGAKEPSARQLYRSVRALDGVPDYVQVWPGHGAGSACGKALGAVPASTMGYERRFNAAIRAASGDEEGFVSFILKDQPEPPLYFATMKRLNRDGPRVLGRLPRPARLSARELWGLDGERVAIIDTRAWDAFRSGHVAGSLSIPQDRMFTTNAGSLVREDEEVYLVVGEGRLEEAVRDLVRIGLDRISGWASPDALEGAPESGREAEELPEIGPEEAAELVRAQRVRVLDVRRGAEFAGGHVPGAMNIAHTRLAARLDEVPADRPVLVNCLSGGRSARACSLLRRARREVLNLRGGITAWEGASLEVER